MTNKDLNSGLAMIFSFSVGLREYELKIIRVLWHPSLDVPEVEPKPHERELAAAIIHVVATVRAVVMSSFSGRGGRDKSHRVATFVQCDLDDNNSHQFI